ncbi:MAG: hypothetical protein JSU83_16745 [Deltaproteobacteria bacterium]|nr:MAG: hypothetical protein JSU83_16745 [Deltaproteobacteria bacterium]
MVEKMKKIKWYDTWWGALWALAIIDGSLGRSVRAFTEVDEALRDLDAEGESAVNESSHADTNSTVDPCPTGSSAYCKALWQR